jgi:AbrB family looped-hinge helix DNA binding protein
MRVTLTAKRQVTFPASVLLELGVAPGDRLEIVRGSEGFLIRPKRIDVSRLAMLRGKLKRGVKPFDVDAFRTQPYDSTLRD